MLRHVYLQYRGRNDRIHSCSAHGSDTGADRGLWSQCLCWVYTPARFRTVLEAALQGFYAEICHAT